jgi:hypothetical protein
MIDNKEQLQELDAIKEALNISLFSKSFKCCKETDKCIISQCDDCKMVYNL